VVVVEFSLGTMPMPVEKAHDHIARRLKQALLFISLVMPVSRIPKNDRHLLMGQNRFGQRCSVKNLDTYLGEH
jgi:hypothetical protein